MLSKIQSLKSRLQNLQNDHSINATSVQELQRQKLQAESNTPYYKSTYDAQQLAATQVVREIANITKVTQELDSKEKVLLSINKTLSGYLTDYDPQLFNSVSSQQLELDIKNLVGTAEDTNNE